MDTTFNLATTHTGTVGGYTRTQRAAIGAADVVKLKSTAVRKILDPVISTRDRITSFNPEDLRNTQTNFFSFVASWREQIQAINIHLRSFYMHNVFVVCQMATRQARDPATGALRFQLDATGNPVLDAARRDHTGP